MSENYKGTIVKISNLRKHSNADRLQCTNLFGNNVIVGLNTKIGDIGIFFPLESALSAGFIYENNLSTKPELNKDQKTKGYFGSHGRVKAQTFRDEKSMGFWIPINSLDYLKIPNETLVEGLELDEYNGHRICSKYIPVRNTPSLPKPKSGKVHKKRESRIYSGQFRFHYDTSHLGKNMHRIKPDNIISITWKFHGTSAIAANVVCKNPRDWKIKLVNWIALKLTGKAFYNDSYQEVYASRKVIKNEFMENDPSKKNYYSYDLWTEIGKQHFHNKLQPGESIYYEIVGYTKDGGAIQKGYDYGCNPNPIYDFAKQSMSYDHDKAELKPQHKVYVYRITRTDTAGNVTELSWEQVKDRCKELGVDHVVEIYHGEADYFYPCELAIPDEEALRKWREEFLDTLQKAYVCDQDSQFCENKVPEEGVVLRKEGLYLEAFKLKSFRFMKHESDELDKGEVDLETSQTLEEDDSEQSGDTLPTV